MKTLEDGDVLLATILWICAFSSFLGALRFQIARLVDYLKKDEKKKH